MEMQNKRAVETMSWVFIMFCWLSGWAALSYALYLQVTSHLYDTLALAGLFMCFIGFKLMSWEKRGEGKPQFLLIGIMCTLIASILVIAIIQNV